MTLPNNYDEELFTRIVNSNRFHKRSNIDLWQGPNYTHDNFYNLRSVTTKLLNIEWK